MKVLLINGSPRREGNTYQIIRHGKCCVCVAHHREHGKLHACLRTQDSRE